MKKLITSILIVVALLGIAYAGGTATGVWTAPTTHTDGTPIVGGLKEFRVYQGTAPRTYSTIYTVPAASPRQIILTLPTGTFYFAITAVTQEGAESDYSNELSKYFPAQKPSACTFSWQ
jgi:hypothetical protein